jgi:hypothetical protein
MTGRTLLKLFGYGDLFNGVVTTDAGCARNGLVWSVGVWRNQRFVFLMGKGHEATFAAHVQRYPPGLSLVIRDSGWSGKIECAPRTSRDKKTDDERRN